jgi:hypothetical protein
MSRNWIRKWSLTVGGSAGGLDLSAMRIKFEIHHMTTQSPNTLIARVYNLSKTTAKIIQNEFTTVQLSAGYEDNIGLIFKGDIKQKITGRETPTETYIDIIAADFDAAYTLATVQTTLAAGSTPRDHWNAVLTQMKPFGVTEGYVSPGILDQPKYPRAVTLYGMAREVLRTLARTANANWSIQSGKLNMVSKTSSIPGNAVVLNSATGLIGLPTETITGIMVRALINPNFKVDTILQIDQASIDRAQLTQLGTSGAQQLGTLGGTGPDGKQIQGTLGTGDGFYRVLYIDWNGDNRGTSWYADMDCVGVISTHGAIPMGVQEQYFGALGSGPATKPAQQ